MCAIIAYIDRSISSVKIDTKKKVDLASLTNYYQGQLQKTTCHSVE
jgi:hypothetical protein